MKRIGIDVGGTNTDAAFVDGDRVMASVKTPTTADVTSGVKKALARLLGESSAARAAQAVIVGTTHFVNAVIERKQLERVAVIRLCLPASASVQPLIDWPAELRDAVRGQVALLPGGHEIDGREIAPLDESAIYATARRIADAGISSVAISSVFSPLRADHEERTASIVRSVLPQARLTLSKDLGRIGLLERENVTILNSALSSLAQRTTAAFRSAIADSGLGAQLYLTQNDGTVMSAEMAEQFPVLCFASGPTNSMRGAAFLSGIDEAAVVDVGGTTTDIGILKNGFPRETNTVIEIGGVRTLFRMPDVISIALGGGTRIRTAPLRLGPDSLGFTLVEHGRVFGGNDLCTTDVAVARGLVALGDPKRVAGLDDQLVLGVLDEARRRLEDGIDRMKTQAGDIRLIAVGGGSFLVPKMVKGVSEVVFVPHHEVANAIGAAIAQISGEVDQVFSDLSREEAIAQATALAQARAEKAGAVPDSLSVVDVEELPLTYMPGNCRRVRVRVAGKLA
ncbi:MAG TPA: hydantoinase/oxoprolinase family protein [Steroidobacteraceae bacterium]|nr:hydantoinase/oxoprolinase family protein [Steroidobacteraceae bacterium]